MSAIVFGASGGIGRALVEGLVQAGHAGEVFAVSRTGVEIDGARALTADILDEASLVRLVDEIGANVAIDLCIVATGLLSRDNALRPEKSWRDMSLEAFEEVFRVNTFGPALVAKHILQLMPRKERAVFAALSARVGSISDNRLGGWYSYRASKAALNMLIKTLAIEQSRRNREFISVCLHPGTVDTGLSKPFQGNVPEGKLFSTQQSAQYLLNVIASLTPEASGKLFDWAGEEVQP